MGWIDFQLINDQIVCIYNYKNKKYKFSENYAKRLFRYLVEKNSAYEEITVEGVRTIRFNNIKEEIIATLKNNKKNCAKKVKRINKYAGPIIAAGSLLSILLILNSMGLLDFKNKYNEVEKDVYSTVKSSSNLNSDLEQNIIVPDKIFEFSYEDRSDSDRANLARSLYTDVVDKYSQMYGLPSQLMLAIGTQERGTHSTEVSPGGGFGLFQIQVENGWNWVGKEVRAYNFETNSYETITVCQQDNGTIDVNMLADLEYNTKVACMIMSYDLAYCNYDLIAAIQTYNSGTGVMSLKNEYGDDWVNYRGVLPGDPEYLEHVLSYIPEDDSLLEYSDSSGKEYTVDINNAYVNYANKTR